MLELTRFRGLELTRFRGHPQTWGEEIAEPILWLLSPAASFTTGAVLRVAGGR
jgi:NAD(P)-dependent dehydrogenase (short-subunit alcohol dehydrogenase family)